MTRFALLERLKAAQQMPKHQGRDITTISAFLTYAALVKHVELCEEAAGIPPQQAVKPSSDDARSNAGRA
jgi:hypothetical protein